MYPRQAPILLTHVCRHWREVATNFPPLWARISLSFKEGHGYSNSQRPIYDEWLNRSKSAALNLHIEIKRRWIYDTVSNVPNIHLDGILIPASQSLTRLTLNRVPARHVQALPSGLFGSLEYLVVRPVNDRDGWFSPPARPPMIEAFREAPSLRRAALVSGEQGTNIALPLEQLTHCVLGCDGCRDAHRPFLAHEHFNLM